MKEVACPMFHGYMRPNQGLIAERDYLCKAPFKVVSKVSFDLLSKKHMSDKIDWTRIKEMDIGTISLGKLLTV